MQTTSFIVARGSLASISEAVGSLFCQLSEQLLLTLADLRQSRLLSFHASE